MELVRSLPHCCVWFFFSFFPHFPWFTISPVLMVRDFFLWGYLKQRVTGGPTQNKVAEVGHNQELLRQVFDNFVTRLRQHTTSTGGHINKLNMPK